MSNVPSAVRKQGEESERLAKEHGLTGEKPEGQGKHAPKPDEAATATPQPADKSKLAEEETAEYWKTRFTNYKATTDQTIADLREQVESNQHQNTELQRQVQELLQKVQEPESGKPAGDGGQGEIDIDALPADLRENYDPEFLKSMSKLNQVQTLRIIGDMQTRLDKLEGNVEKVQTTQTKSARELYYEKLDKEEPEWEKIGADQGFVEYLRNPVSEFDSRPLSEVLNNADKSNDADTVLKVIAAYKQANGTVGSSTGQPGSDTTLDELSSPTGGNGSDDVVTEIGIQTETFTESQVNKFYVDQTRGKYTDEQAAAIEKNIQAAGKAGRIIPG